MKTEYVNSFLCCPQCKGNLKKSKDFIYCRHCDKQYPIKNGYVRMLAHSTDDIELSIEKWDELYKKQYKNRSYNKDFEEYRKRYFKSVYSQINSEKRFKNKVYLEIGCGPFFVGQLVAHEAKLIIGIDFCPHALLIAQKMLKEKGIGNYLLIQADILQMPLKSKTVDLIYGGGVIEHFKDTKTCLGELSRVLKKGGVSINTVPHLNLGSLTYRQVWGNIPNIPLLKQLAEFIHIRLLKGKHMIFGYEMSFLGSHLKNLHREAGFSASIVKNFEIEPEFNFIPASARKPFVYLAKNSPLFWPMIKISAFK